MPDKSTIQDIVETAFTIERLARDIYSRFADLADDPGLARFWRDFSRDEGEHLDFWKGLSALGESLDYFLSPEDPDVLLGKLEKCVTMASDLAEDVETREIPVPAGEALLSAYRLELHMLDPTFQNLFQSLRFLQEDFDPVEAYDVHIDRFIDGLSRFGSNNLETELLGETLGRLWSENKRLSSLALHDSLTGALNRRGFMTLGAQICSLMRRRRSRVGVVMIDLNRFKHLNDTLGHPAGDRALIRTVQVLDGMLRESDLVGRYGGDEFVVLLPDTDTVEVVTRKMVDTLNGALEKEFGLSVTAGSAQGIIDCDRVRDCLTDLMRKADEELCGRKSTGRS